MQYNGNGYFSIREKKTYPRWNIKPVYRRLLFMQLLLFKNFFFFCFFMLITFLSLIPFSSHFSNYPHFSLISFHSCLYIYIYINTFTHMKYQHTWICWKVHKQTMIFEQNETKRDLFFNVTLPYTAHTSSIFVPVLSSNWPTSHQLQK